jgi:hypothetical protein
MSATVKITVADLREGRAYIRFPLAAKLNLCHWAGAPWAERKPNAWLHGLQVEVLARKEREKIVHGASRLGKSVLGGCDIIIGLHTHNARVGVFAHRWDHVAHEFRYAHVGVKNIYRGHPGAIKTNIFRNQGSNQQYHIATSWNSIAKGHSAGSDDGAAALGQEFTLVVLGEGSHISAWIRQRVLQRAIDGALMNQQFPREDIGRLCIYTTPKSFEGCSAARVDQIRKEYGNQNALEYGKAPWPDTCWIREAAISENPAYDLRALKAAQKALDPAAFEEQYLGKMVFRSGRIYEEFTELMTVEEPSEHQLSEMSFAIGIDTGAYFGAVLLGLDRDRELWVLSEVYTQKKDIDYSCAAVKAGFAAFFKRTTGISDWDQIAKRVKYLYIDPASQHKIEVSNRLGMTPRHPNRREGTFELLPTIDYMRHMMTLSKFWISKRCTWTLDQIRKYVWKETRSPGSKEPVIREPKKDYDHLMDAMRFGAVPLIQRGPAEEEPEPMTLKQAQAAQLRDCGWGAMKREMHRAQRRDKDELF